MPSAAHARRRLAGIGVLAVLLLVLHLRLLSALLVALGVYVCLVRLRDRLARHVSPRLAVGLSLAVVLLAFAALAAGLAEIVHVVWAPGGLPGLLDLLADTLERLRSTLPAWLSARLPASWEDLQQLAAGWLRGNAHEVQRWGQVALRIAAHSAVGLIIGLLGALERTPKLPAAWMDEVADCWRTLALAFARFVGAQLRIAAVNTVLTALFLLVALPLAGLRLPLSTTLVLLTFFAGLIPIVGNLVSNGAIVLAAVTVSPAAALACLVFLAVVHKLEYFLNAHFVGERTNVPAPVLLAAMLLLDAAFGLAGLVAAPIYCAWVFAQFGGSPAAAGADAERLR